MVSTHKMVIMAIFVQIILGSIVTIALNPATLPSAEIASSTGIYDNVRDDTSDFDDLVTRDPDSIAGSADSGLNVVTAVAWMFDVFFSGFIIPWTYAAGDIFEQLILWGIRLWHTIIMGFFAMEAYMFFVSKKQS